MNGVLLLVALVLIAILINIPLGYLRQGAQKFTFAWYFYIHLSIPFIIYLRVKSGYSWKFIPLTLGGAFLGQFIGGRQRRRKEADG